MSEPMNKAQRLAIAAAAAPSIRSRAALARKVHIVNAAGEVVGTTTLSEVQKAVLARHAIEIDVQDDVRPEEVPCRACGKPVKVARGGVIPSVCIEGCVPACACGATIARKTVRAAALAGREFRCKGCAARHRNAVRTAEQRALIAEKRRAYFASLSPEQLSQRGREANASRTPEQMSADGRRSWETRRARIAQSPPSS